MAYHVLQLYSGSSQLHNKLWLQCMLHYSLINRYIVSMENATFSGINSPGDNSVVALVSPM